MFYILCFQYYIKLFLFLFFRGKTNSSVEKIILYTILLKYFIYLNLIQLVLMIMNHYF